MQRRLIDQISTTLLFGVMLLASWTVRAERVFEPRAVQAVAASFPGAKVLDAVEGDLDGDGLPDLACVLYLQTGEFVVAVYRQTAENKLVLWHQSKPSPAYQRAPEILIEKRSLFVQEFRNSSTARWGDKNQYQYRNGQFRLIGSEGWWESWDDDPEPKQAQTVSKNYLTRIQTATTRDGKKVTRERSVIPTDEADKTLEDLEGL
jgi:hypothetical protein